MKSKVIGIIGGGQLGRMLALAASRLGFQVIVLDPDENCPAAQLCTSQIVGPYDDEAALHRLAQQVDVVTYEFENVPVASAEALANQVKIFPPPRALEMAQDRLVEKQFFAQCAIETAPYWPVQHEDDLLHALKLSGGASILKTRRFGYDGKGQVRLDGRAGAAQIKQAMADIAHAPAILEGFVDFSCEISLIAARDQAGEMVCFDIPENVHRDGILRRSSVPAKIEEKLAYEARAAITRLMSALDYVGIMALEFFVTREGKLIANEFAPRVHNSGHWTEAACCLSQFDLHIRAITGLPLVKPSRHSDCVMENLIGDDMELLPDLLAEENVLIHLYGKREVRSGRKMGHFTRIL